MTQGNNTFKMDALLPPEMAAKAEEIGVRKAHMDFVSMFLLSVLAGIFIALAAGFYTVVMTGAGASMPFGMAKLVGGLAFCVGLVLVVIAGAELFTGNNLIVMALASRRIGILHVLRNWVIVYAGNFAGSVLTAWLILGTRQYEFAGGAVGETAMGIASAKCQLAFGQALWLGVACNALVCLAVWLCLSARTSAGKILCIVFPITAFVVSGFEHSVANMYFIPAGLMIKAANGAGGLEHLTLINFLVRNLLPVTIGNIIGGAGLIGALYWIIYSRRHLTDRKALQAAGRKAEAAWEMADGLAGEADGGSTPAGCDEAPQK